MKHSLLFLFSVVLLQSYGQDSTKTLHKNIFIGIGGIYSFHQDVRYSATQHKGFGTGINIGTRTTSTKRFSTTQLLVQQSTERPTTFDSPAIFSKHYHISLFYKYLYRLTPEFSVGGRMELLNGYFRQTKSLSNNSINYLVGNTWYLSGGFHKKINEEWSFIGLLDFALFSFQKGTTGFGFSAPHRVLNKGDFNYQDNFEVPNKLQGYGIDPFWKSLSIKSMLEISYKERISFSYNWIFGRFVATKHYPIYTGSHGLMIRYNLYNKRKVK